MTSSQPRDETEHAVGRRPTLTEDVQRAVVDALEAGAHLRIAAAVARISDRTLHSWLKRGRDELARVMPDGEPTDDEADTLLDLEPTEERYVRFLLAVERAEAVAELNAVQTWSRAASYDWRAARDLLGRRHPDRWAQTSSLTVSAAEADKRVQETAAGILDDLGLGADLDDDTGDGGQP